MQEEGVLNWEKIVIVLIGIVILASILLILRNRSKINRKRIEREDMLQKDLEQIAKKHVKHEGFRKSKLFAIQQGRGLSVTLYFYLKEERSLRELDALRAKILQDLRSYSSWCEADVVFTLDASWVPLAMPLAVASTI